MHGSNESKELKRAPRLENIEVMELIGEGGVSTVYRARQLQLDRTVAVKCLKTNVSTPQKIERFNQEARISLQLKHTNIVETYSSNTNSEGVPFIVMEYVEGENLSSLLKKKQILQFKEFRDLFLPLLDALQYAHEMGVVHRDIKPSNILLPKEADSLALAKLSDFGLAKYLESEQAENTKLTQTGVIIGTPNYMSPEQGMHKEIDPRSDIYSIACIMFESLCGRIPFEGDSAFETINKHCTAARPKADELSKEHHIPKRLAASILMALDIDPEARPISAREFATKLAAVLDEITLDKIPSKRKKDTQKRNVVAIASVMAALLAFVFLFANESAKRKERRASAIIIENKLDKALQIAYLAQKALNENEAIAADKYLRLSLETAGSRQKSIFSLEESTKYRRILEVLTPIAIALQNPKKISIVPSLDRNLSHLQSSDKNFLPIELNTAKISAAYGDYNYPANSLMFSVASNARQLHDKKLLLEVMTEINKYPQSDLTPNSKLRIQQISMVFSMSEGDTDEARSQLRAAQKFAMSNISDERDRVNFLVEMIEQSEILYDDKEMNESIRQILKLLEQPIDSPGTFSGLATRNSLGITTTEMNELMLKAMDERLKKEKWKDMVRPVLNATREANKVEESQHH